MWQGVEVWTSGNEALSLLSPPQDWRTTWTLSHSEGPVCINCREISPMPLPLPSTLSEMCNRITSRRPIWNSVTWRFYEAMPLLLCLAAQSCPTLCNPMDCSPPGSSVHGDSPGKSTGVSCHALLQRSSQPRDWTQVSHITCRFFTIWTMREAHKYWSG